MSTISSSMLTEIPIGKRSIISFKFITISIFSWQMCHIDGNLNRAASTSQRRRKILIGTCEYPPTADAGNNNEARSISNRDRDYLPRRLFPRTAIVRASFEKSVKRKRGGRGDIE